MANWQNGKLAKWQIDKLAKWQNWEYSLDMPAV
jgi:hypothetical protein